MTDPKNIPLAEARPGDMVFPNPMTFVRVDSDGDAVLKAAIGDVYLRPEDIDHIERAPKILKVGDRVMWKGRARVAWEIVFLDGLQAVLKVDGHGGGFTGLNLADFTDLEPVE